MKKINKTKQKSNTKMVFIVAFLLISLLIIPLIVWRIQNGSFDVFTKAAGTVNVVPTFHSLGIEWDAPAGSSSIKANIQFRKVGEQQWHEGFPLWYSQADGLYRGSLVHLQPDTNYEIQMSLEGLNETASTTAKTWSENFPIAKTIELPESSNSTLSITQSGTANGYILYTHAPGKTATIDGNRSTNYNIDLRASYIIIRGLTLKNPSANNIKMATGAHHVVIENNEFTGWGTTSTSGAIDSNSNSTITDVIIQRNKFYNPATDTNSWGESDPGVKDSSQGSHPGGPQAIHMYNPGGSFVIRYNEIFSTNGNRFNDCIGGGSNFSTQGFPPKNSDIYGNYMEKCWDNAIESEGGNENVRIWGNYMEETYKSLATRDSNKGPLYMWRNVTNISEKLPKEFWPWNQDPGGSFHKAGGEEGNDLGVFVFHNTILQPTISGNSGTYGASQGPQGPMDNTTTRNNIFHVRTSSAYSIQSTNGAASNSFDYDLYNGVLSPSGIESHGIKGVPTYSSNVGFNLSNRTGIFTLASNSLGYDKGLVIPNFNSEHITGSGPDVGAHEAGMAAMEFGVNAYRNGEIYTIGSGTYVLPPTSAVSIAPTATLVPSVNPSANPTVRPTNTPTRVPSLTPTRVPTGSVGTPIPTLGSGVSQIAFEAENFTLSGSFVTKTDSQASGGTYLTTVTGSATRSPVVEASQTVTVPAGTYALWVRMYGASNSTDASYVAINNTWKRTYPSTKGQYQWVKVFTKTQLAQGQHTISIGRGEVGARIDALYLTNNLSENPPTTLPTLTPKVRVEAESFTIQGNLVRGNDTQASGGVYLTSSASVTSPNADASYAVTLPSGTYTLWARLYGSTSTSDATYVGINGSMQRVYPSVLGQYQWVEVRSGVSLSQGNQTISLGRAESGARVDAVYVTNDANDVP